MKDFLKQLCNYLYCLILNAKFCVDKIAACIKILNGIIAFVQVIDCSSYKIRTYIRPNNIRRTNSANSKNSPIKAYE